MKIQLAVLASVVLAAPIWVRSASPVAAPVPGAVASAAEDATIAIRDFAFAPVSITVAPGTTVRWKNMDGEPHTVRSIDASFRSDALDENDSFTFRFDKPGTYRYVCSIHPQMVGTIVVKSP